MTIRELVQNYATGYSGTGYAQVLEVTLVDNHTGEILFSKMRAEGFVKLINPELEVSEWRIRLGAPYAISSEEEREGHKRQRIILEIYAPVMDEVPNYYSDEEWELIKSGKCSW